MCLRVYGGSQRTGWRLLRGAVSYHVSSTTINVSHRTYSIIQMRNFMVRRLYHRSKPTHRRQILRRARYSSSSTNLGRLYWPALVRVLRHAVYHLLRFSRTHAYINTHIFVPCPRRALRTCITKCSHAFTTRSASKVESFTSRQFSGNLRGRCHLYLE